MRRDMGFFVRFLRSTLRAVRRSVARLRPAWSRRTREASSPMLTSSTQWSSFSIAQCRRESLSSSSGAKAWPRR